MDKTLKALQEALALLAVGREIFTVLEQTVNRIANNPDPVTDAELDALSAQRRAALARLAELGS